MRESEKKKERERKRERDVRRFIRITCTNFNLTDH
jgi:hypothetical protein